MASWYATFSGLPTAPIFEADFLFSRGVRPSVCLLKTFPLAACDRATGTLSFKYGDTTVLSFPDCAVAGKHFAPHHGRDEYRWTLAVYDRRWAWRYPRISGTYNERAAGSVQPVTEMSARDLASLCLDAMGETDYDVSSVPDDVYPPVRWKDAIASLELEWLCDLVGCVVVLRPTDNKVAIKPLNDPSASSLPSGTVLTPPTRSFKQSVMPSRLAIRGGPTVYQSALVLSAVGMDTDGSIKLLANCSWYNDDDWYSHWPTVTQANRHLAFQTGYRWYMPTDGWDDSDVTITDARQIELLPFALESVADFNGALRPVPAMVQGVYWPQCDLPTNTASDTAYAGAFRIIPELCLVEFEYPVIKWSSGAIAAADLELITGYMVRKPDMDGYATYERTKDVSAAVESTSDRVLRHPELTKYKVTDSLTGAGAWNNLTALNTEADSYLDAIEATYDHGADADVFYSGILAINPSGGISQIRWKCGGSAIATTRVGVYTEFAMYGQHHQDRRRAARVAQLSEMFCL